MDEFIHVGRADRKDQKERLVCAPDEKEGMRGFKNGLEVVRPIVYLGVQSRNTLDTGPPEGRLEIDEGMARAFSAIEKMPILLEVLGNGSRLMNPVPAIAVGDKQEEIVVSHRVVVHGTKYNGGRGYD